MKVCKVCGASESTELNFHGLRCQVCERLRIKQATTKYRKSAKGRVAAIKASQAYQRKLKATPEGLEKINKASRKSHRKRYQNGKYSKWFEAYMDSNPLAKMRQRLSCLIRMSMRYKGWSKTTKTQVLVGCDFEFLLNHLKSTLPDYEDHPVIHIDHILPCSCAETVEELEALQHWTNLQWLPGPENLSKSDTLPPDWAERKQKLMLTYSLRIATK